MEETKNRNMYINIIITQGICVLIVLLSVIALKYFFKVEFKEVEKWYNTEICADTKIEEVIE